MPPRSQTIEPQQGFRRLLVQRAEKILKQLLRQEESADPEKKAGFLLRMTRCQRIMAHAVARLKDYPSLTEYILGVLDRDMEEFLSEEVKEWMEKKIAQDS